MYRFSCHSCQPRQVLLAGTSRNPYANRAPRVLPGGDCKNAEQGPAKSQRGHVGWSPGLCPGGTTALKSGSSITRLASARKRESFEDEKLKNQMDARLIFL